MTFVFRNEESLETVDRVGEELAAAIEEDPTLGGRFRPNAVELREARKPSQFEQTRRDRENIRIIRLSVTDLV